jgi:hypothetical protein
MDFRILLNKHDLCFYVIIYLFHGLLPFIVSRHDTVCPYENEGLRQINYRYDNISICKWQLI